MQIQVKKVVVIGLLGVAAGLLVSYILQPSALDPARSGQAQAMSERILILDRDTYIVTSDESGRAVYLYYFERRGTKKESQLYYITSASAETGPLMK